MVAMAHISFAAVKQAAYGRWPEILAALGVDSNSLANRHGPCPGCGGKDRFRFDNKTDNGDWICGGGGNPRAGDGFGLLQHVFGWTPSEALRAVADYLGIDGSRVAQRLLKPSPVPAQRQKPTTPKTAKYAEWLWRTANREDAYVASHPYAVAKGISWAAGAGRAIASGRVVGEHEDCIIVPIRNLQTGEIQGVQIINAKGAKQTFGAVSGGALILGNTLDPRLPWYVVEGGLTRFPWRFTPSGDRL